MIVEKSKSNNLLSDISSMFTPPPALSVSDWADQYRFLSSESASEAGKYNTSRCEYQRGIQDAFSNPRIQSIVVMSSAQIGKSTILENCLGYLIHLDPCPVMIVMPTLSMSQSFSKDRLSPMLRDTTVLTNLVADFKSRDGNNTILEKHCAGGHITLTGANSPSSLSSRPIKTLFLDEVDRYPESAGSEGDPVNLAIKRTATFYNRKILLTSTPTIKDKSRIEKAYNTSDKRKYFVPCPHCNKYQILIFDNIKWDKDDNNNHIPETAYYECNHCHEHLNDNDINKAVKNGDWISTLLTDSFCIQQNEFKYLVEQTIKESKNSAGFHIWEIYSPFRTLLDIVSSFLEAKKDIEQLITWINTCKGESFEDNSGKIETSTLLSRVEEYNAEVPIDAVCLTAGVDVQKDRLEIQIIGWGSNQESWSIGYYKIFGDTADVNNQTWQDLDELLQREYKHESGASLSLSSVCIDSGYNTQAVYDFCKTKYTKRIYCVKGSNNNTSPVVGKKSVVKYGKNGSKTCNLFSIGVDQAKRITYFNLSRLQGESGYMHFGSHCDQHYFNSLTSEKLVNVNGKEIFKKHYERNEVLDLTVYAYAALKILNPNIEKIKNNLLKNLINYKIDRLRNKLLAEKAGRQKDAWSLAEGEQD